MTANKKTSYTVAKHPSSPGRFRTVFGSLMINGGVTRVMDAESYHRAAKKAGRVLQASTGGGRFASDLGRAKSK